MKIDSFWGLKEYSESEQEDEYLREKLNNSEK